VILPASARRPTRFHVAGAVAAGTIVLLAVAALRAVGASAGTSAGASSPGGTPPGRTAVEETTVGLTVGDVEAGHVDPAAYEQFWSVRWHELRHAACPPAGATGGAASVVAVVGADEAWRQRLADAVRERAAECSGTSPATAR
jgi:hypothetical protein